MSNDETLEAATKYFEAVTNVMPPGSFNDDFRLWPKYHIEQEIWEHPNKGLAILQQHWDCVSCMTTDGSTISAWTSKHFTPEQTVKAFKDFLAANPKKEEKAS